ncbi:dirigent protein 6-like [Panicum miliaceum]|uniref:Dirigent protein n=1 Tax=Panicum miliaceum TaxID=4540 RepID=A0A3L6RQC2_PANMI|nr:dirigent protein 6-like [Panicum miliaceum]
MPTSKLSLIAATLLLLLLLRLTGVTHGRRRISGHGDEPCLKMTVYYHDILYDGSNTANATSAVAAQPTLLSRSVSVNDTYFGEIVVFNDAVTVGPAPVARAEGFYVYDKKERTSRGWPSHSSSTPRSTRAPSTSWAPTSWRRRPGTSPSSAAPATSSWRAASPRCAPIESRACTTSGSGWTSSSTSATTSKTAAIPHTS